MAETYRDAIAKKLALCLDGSEQEPYRRYPLADAVLAVPDPAFEAANDEILRLDAEVTALRSRIGEVVAMLLRGGTTDHDRRRSAYAALTRPADDVCGHGIPRALVDCEKCETAGKANADA